MDLEAGAAEDNGTPECFDEVDFISLQDSKAQDIVMTELFDMGICIR